LRREQLQQATIENGIAADKEKKLGGARPNVDNLFDPQRFIRSSAKRQCQLRPRPRWASQFFGDSLRRGRKDCRALNSATLQRSQQAFQRRDSAQLDQCTRAIGQDNAFASHRDFA
jgi:hypothetical protein